MCGTGRSSGSFRGWSDQAMERIPRIARVEPLGQAELLVRFENGVDKIYDCRPLLGRPQFGLLANGAFFPRRSRGPGRLRDLLERRPRPERARTVGPRNSANPRTGAAGTAHQIK